MNHYILELVLWILLAVFLGCIIGYMFRRIFGGSAQRQELLEESHVITPASSVPVVKAVTAMPVAAALVSQSDGNEKTLLTDTVILEEHTNGDVIPVAEIVTAKALPSADVQGEKSIADKKATSKAPQSAVIAGPSPEVVVKSAPAVKKTAAEPLKVKPSSPAKQPVASTGASGKMKKPRGIKAPRKGKADNLQRLSGVGPKYEQVLHSLGFYHFDQIAEWTPDQVAWVDDHLNFNGRIEREEWINQAKLLAENKEDTFHKLYGSGGLKTKNSKAESGSRTRRKP